MSYSGNDVDAYLMNHSTPESPILKRLYKETYLTQMHPRMLSGHLQGKLLEMISLMICPDRILEIGTYTGYSAICLAKGLSKGGVVHTIELDDEREEIILKYFSLAGIQDSIVLHIGDACSIIPTLKEPFDLIFLDADKCQYPAYYELVIPRMKSGAFLLADNVLWGGKVLQHIDENDRETIGIQTFNQLVAQDQRVENVMLPLRDGIMIIRKK